ncbi:MAG: NmrA family NAD(P)-binding protein [Sneathiella sp.]
MSTKPKILVTSATGRTGTPTARQLLEKGYPVRAFVRRLDHRSDALEKAGAEIFCGNQYSITDMRAAMVGVKRAFQCAPAAPNALQFNVIFTVAAYEAKLEHVVNIGQWLASADHPSVGTRAVYLADILIKIPTGLTSTNINVGWFADNYMRALESAAQLGVFSMPFGDGTVKKNAAPSNEDIARVAVGALIDPATHAGKTYRPSGPELLSPDDIAAAMGRALGRKVKYRDISEEMMFKAVKASPPPGYTDTALTQVRQYAAEYRHGAFGVNAVTRDVEIVGGRKPENMETITRRYMAENPDAYKPSFAGKMKAIGGILKILTTRAPNINLIEKQKDLVKIASPTYCLDDAEWCESHKPKDLKLVAGQVA